MSSTIKLFISMIGYLSPICLSPNVNNQAETPLKWYPYEINPEKVEGTSGQVWLSENESGQIYNALNLLILKNSEFLFNNPKDFNLNSEDGLKRIFIKDEPLADNQTEIVRRITTQLFFRHSSILSYKIRLDYKADKGSPYIRFLNINLRENKLITVNDLIDSSKLEQVKAVLLNYENHHKQEIIKNYQQTLSERADQLLYEEQQVFLRPGYMLNKVLIKKSYTAQLFNMQKKGIEVIVSVRDLNFKKYKDSNEYKSVVLIPYKIIEPYLNTKSSLYTTIMELSGAK